MTRLHSNLACSGALAAIALIGIVLVLFPADVSAVGLEKLVMPGRVIEGHAETESECTACHDDASDAATATLCTSCHEDVGKDRESGTGFHGLSSAAKTSECITCHTDHEGRDADIVGRESGLFDHDITDFPLTFAHLTVGCESCHGNDDSFRDAPGRCIDCHREDDVHAGALGSRCESCHDAERWSTIHFDHADTGYTLTGAHADVLCGDCHSNNSFENTPRACVSCHAIDDVHEGNNGSACQECHSTSTWRSIGFDHAAETGFALTAGHGGLICDDCHKREDHKDDFSAGCIACHAPDDFHQGRNGTQCNDCHAATRWPENHFDHGETGFALVEAHTSLNCTSCHKQSVDTSIGTDCGSCHAFDDAHGGELGNACGECHTQSSWRDMVAFDHDLSSFPLTGLHATVPCGACHENARFGATASDCRSCHADDDVHDGSLGNDCGACHTSNGWSATVFDHDVNTSFPLDGGHSDLDCTACHRDPNADASDVPSTCGGCHLTDDVHDGQFGTQCGDCHSTQSFSDVETLGRR